ncbi:MAG: LD-carboxypeptidase [Casimicrobiaceae bacterium]|nr:LD-carboxypeptidase [Casimicrobiaceae bacterium]MDW8311953.1 LD-carboxypeptidase [Burkholderiales bacterium]
MQVAPNVPRWPERRGRPLRVHALSLSGAADPGCIERGAKRLLELGFEVIVPAAARAASGYFAGSDEVRLAALEAALASDADIVLFTRGGYGLSRLLHRIDWARVAASGKLFCGYSDVTAFSMAALARAGFATLAGPVLAGDFAGDPSEDRDFNEAQWLGLIDALATASAWSWPEFEADQAAAADGFRAEGVLWGTNLSLIAHLIGTPYLPAIEGGILVLEDIGEYPYRVERMFWQLKHAGILDRQAAIVLGEFTDCNPSPGMRGPHTMEDALSALRTMTATPVFTGFPFGHGARRVTLPLGARAVLEVGQGRARLALPAAA